MKVIGTTNYLYDGEDSLEEVDTTGNVLARYTRGPGIDQPLAEVRSGTTSYYEADGLGSITSLSNSSGALANTYTYDSFGNLTASTGTLTNPLRYTAREFDNETGLYFYRTRYYDPGSGRFTREDPIQFIGGSNFYAYTLGNPVNHVDPDGELTQVAFGGMVGDNVFGHVSIIINGEVFSYGTNYTHGPPGIRDWGRDAETFLDAQGNLRATTLVDLNITDKQEATLLDFLRRNNPYRFPYGTLSHSCVTATQDALTATNILRQEVLVNSTGAEIPTATALTPAGLSGELIAQGLAGQSTTAGNATTGFWRSFFGTLGAAFH